MTDCVFLDANILFSAAWLEDAGLKKLWRMSGAELFSSRVAFAEAERNLETEQQRIRLRALAEKVALFDAPPDAALPAGVELAAKDIPILLAALEAGATHLLTGDRRHFGHLYGKSVDGVKVLMPATYLKSRQRKAFDRSGERVAARGLCPRAGLS